MSNGSITWQNKPRVFRKRIVLVSVVAGALLIRGALSRQAERHHDAVPIAGSGVAQQRATEEPAAPQPHTVQITNTSPQLAQRTTEVTTPQQTPAEQAAAMQAEADRLRRAERMHEAELLENRVADLKAKMDEVETKCAQLETDVKEYMMDHKMAVVALTAGVAGASVAFDSTNKFSDDAKTIGGITAEIALIWAANNMDEVNEVATQLAKDSTEQTDYTNQIDDLKRTIAEEQARIDELQKE